MRRRGREPREGIGVEKRGMQREKREGLNLTERPSSISSMGMVLVGCYGRQEHATITCLWQEQSLVASSTVGYSTQFEPPAQIHSNVKCGSIPILEHPNSGPRRIG
eukprot:scaffold115896_cov32-Attheya_sp.AAC.1